jgi:pyruvate/2-oxoglutarate dehydrogenase complex dihydrolipoamide dehydrogenase (E3) component
VAIGRRPNIDALDLGRRPHQERAALASWSTSASAPATAASIAIGDVTGLPAVHPFREPPRPPLLIRHLLFRLPIKMNVDEIPRVIFTDPELAHVGLTDVAGARSPRRHPPAALALS